MQESFLLFLYLIHQIPLSPNEAAEAEYGNDTCSLETLISHYGSGDSPQVSSDDTKAEWEIFVIFMINNCKTKTMRVFYKCCYKM